MKGIEIYKKGQASILAVLLITGVAIVSAGFAVFVANSIHHARALTGKVSGKDLAMYGVRYAMQQMLESPEGANWRPMPDPNIPWDFYEQRRGWNQQGYVKLSAPNGYFLLKISWRPDGYIEIDSIGRPEPRSSVYHRIIAIVPLPMIQYARFLAARNPYGQNKHIIGLGQIDFDGDGQVSNLEKNSCLVTINGGIYANRDLEFASGSLIRLICDANSQNDGLFVAGSIKVSTADTFELVDENGNPIDPSRQPTDSDSPNFWIFPLNGIPRLRDGFFANTSFLSIGNDTTPSLRRLQPIRRPTIDLQRYRKLVYLGGANLQVIYIDNKNDIQDKIIGAPSNFSPSQVQFWDWINVPNMSDKRRSDPKSGWYINAIDNDGDGMFDEDPIDGVDNDGDGRIDEDPISTSDPYRRNPAKDNTLPDFMRYVPPGCEIELKAKGVDDDKDGRIDEDPVNGVDDDGDGLIDEDPDSDLVKVTRHDNPGGVMSTSHPVNPNGVIIFAEGNVRIKGAINAPLTVISMGTIYIEGSLTTINPTTQHIALIANHNVCLNTTAMMPTIDEVKRPETITIAQDGSQWDNNFIPLHYRYAAVPGPPLPWIRWRIPPLDNSGQKFVLTLLHSGFGDLSDYCFIRLNSDGNTLFHGEPLCYQVLDPDNDGKIGEDPIDNRDNDGDGRIDEDPGQPVRCYTMGASHGIFWLDLTAPPLFTVSAGLLDADNDNDGQPDEDPIDGVDNDGDGKVDEDPRECPYRLSRFKIELLDANGNPIPLWNIRVNAAIYAINGCFFTLPPPYFDETKTGKAAERFRRFNYFDIEINGAIAEFTTAITMARSIGVAAYRRAIDKLAYPVYDNNGNLRGWQLVRFKYDRTLLSNPPLFLPVSPRPMIIYSGL